MLTTLTAAEIARKLARRDVSAIEVAEAFLTRFQTCEPSIGAFLWLDPEVVLDNARKVQQKLDHGEGGNLMGVPVALKDNISTSGIPTTCASKMLEGYVPPFDATVVRKLKEGGCPLFGKTNLDEFAMGTSTENSAFKPTRNPWDLDRSPGGSSGGSAAAVAASMVPLALGSDTGGSIRMPASLCGLVGFKPTYGRVSRFGLVAFGSSLDQIGPFARTVEDASLLAQEISGHDPKDSTSLLAPPISPQLGSRSLKDLRIAVPEELMGPDLSQGVRDQVEKALQLAQKQGARVSRVNLPSLKFGVTTYYIIAPAEASSNLARFDGIRFGPRAGAAGHVETVEKTRGELFGHEVKARIMVGTYALSAGYYDAYYTKAQQVRAAMKREMLGTLHDFDVIAAPTSPIPAFKLGELNQDPLALKLLDLCTIPANMAGLPALSLNCGFVEGLPVGLQLMAAPLEDERLLEVAYAFEQALPDTGLPHFPLG